MDIYHVPEIAYQESFLQGKNEKQVLIVLWKTELSDNYISFLEKVLDSVGLVSERDNQRRVGHWGG